ncbi:high affinity nitrate transporter 2.4-like [Hibiscus syriacus]|uniref:High affinity nitrate transporter 2.4-like n=1 Tax=Hibiscus syriacus TaxID=106335 RepID=A0A6A3B2D6_HIBSY|nr:lysM domain receptor-like kinase 3 [Hibiscus syriacus]KAE8710886.1 high affinity nitrate transporter 2.4-like [Hibiscus syriacus]
MCKTKKAADASEPQPIPSRTRPSQSSLSQPTRSPRTHSSGRSHSQIPSTSNPTSDAHASSSSYTKATSSGTGTSISSRTSLSSLRESLPENPHIYHISEIRAATNNFLAKRYSSSSASTAACWRCNLRGRDTVVFQRKFRRKIQTSQLKERLSTICRSHHVSIIKLIGASISGDHIYLVYEFIEGSNLAVCLRNPRNPNFTVLSTWISRMQIATDLAHGLDYVHNKTGLNLSIVHSHIKSSSIIITEPSFNAKLCHFGTAQLCGETDEDETPEIDISKSETEIKQVTEEGSDASFRKLKRSDSGERKFEGVRGYMSPEFRSSGVATQKSDVFAFGVVILELFSGEEPLKYRYDKKTGNFQRTSVMDTAAEAVADGREGLRRWVDRRLNDSFPVEVGEKLIRLALDCVHVDADKRPDMGRVAGKISKLYLESKIWSDNVNVPTGISVSLAPR